MSARICRYVYNFINKEFAGEEIKTATKKQIKFGKVFGCDFSCMPENVSKAYIKNLLCEFNFFIIEQQNLKPGVWTKNIQNGEIRQILSIDKKGLVIFFDFEGPNRNARYLLRCDPPIDDKPVLQRIPLKYFTHEELLFKLVDCVCSEREMT